MKVSELIVKLQDLKPDLLVVLSRDEEGNGFSPLADIDGENSMYYDGEINLHHLTPGLESKGYTDEDVSDRGERVVVLWP